MSFFRRVTTFALLIAVISIGLAAAGCAVQGESAGGAGQASAVPAGTDPVKTDPAKTVVLSASESPDSADSQGKTGPAAGDQPKVRLGIPAAEAGAPSQGKKMAYLTFDDGPNSQYTEKILDILRKKKVSASFMVVGKNVDLNPRVLQRILADGHVVINHTYSHDYNIIYRSPDSFLADLDRNNRVIAQYTGKPVMIFRAPGGPDKLNREFTAKLQGRGYKSVGWNISAVDSDPRGVTHTQVYGNIASGLARVESLKLTPIILMHDGTQLTTTTATPGSPLAIYIQNREASMAALPAVIDHFRARGYTFAVVDDRTPPAW